AIYKQIPDNGVIIDGILLTKNNLIKHMNSIGWLNNSPNINTYWGNGVVSGMYINYNGMFNVDGSKSYEVVPNWPEDTLEDGWDVVFNQINN
ncbi:MAG: hypothetical protein IIT97_00810, partial [Mycoplasmataceae bacterium]|nr:hypothetical protein [Mycoplasmataceae bacterium]